MSELIFYDILAQGALMRQELKIIGAVHVFTQVLQSNVSDGLNALNMFEPVMKNYMLQV